MLRLSRLAPVAARAAMRASAPRVIVHGRYNSNEASALTPKEKRDKTRADHAKLHDGLRDWQAPIVTYEQLKPKTDSPDPVRSLSLV
jgi:hypothetical protein